MDLFAELEVFAAVYKMSYISVLKRKSTSGNSHFRSWQREYVLDYELGKITTVLSVNAELLCVTSSPFLGSNLRVKRWVSVILLPLNLFWCPSGDALRCYTCMGSNNEDCNRQGSKLCPSFSDACAVVVGHDSESSNISGVAFLSLAPSLIEIVLPGTPQCCKNMQEQLRGWCF